ncbi:MAG: flagellar filament capping protein FliD [Anaerovoracaceae bacterium]
MSSVYGYYGKNISSTSSSSTSLGVSGLVSGMDIDSTVKAMCSGTSAKISKVQQNLMKLEWKQEAYQDVGKAMTEFKDKYLSGTSSTGIASLLSGCYKISSKGDNASAVSASGATSILSSFSVLGVSSLASNASFTSKSGVTDPAISTGRISFSEEETTVSALEGKKFAFKIGSRSYSLELGSEVITDAASAKTALEAAIKKYDQENNTGSSYVSLESQLTIGVENNKLTFATAGSAAAAGSNINISSSSNGTVLKVLGLQKDSEGRLRSGTSFTAEEGDYSAAVTKQSFFSRLSATASLTLDLDGQKATVSFGQSTEAGKTMAEVIREAGEAYRTDHADEADVEEGAQKAMLDRLVSEMKSQLSKVYGNKVNAEANSQGGLSFSTSEGNANSILSVSAASSGLTGESGILGGLAIGAANRLLTGKALEDSNFANKFDFGEDGTNTYELNVNGVSFTIGKNQITVDGKTTEYASGVTMNNVMSAINGSSANVRMSYLSTTDRFTVASTVSGASGTVDISGSFADMIFGSGAGDADDDGVYASNGSGTIGGADDKAAGGNFTKGADAKILVSFDGKTAEEITRSTNSFKLDGLSLSLSATFNADLTAASFTGADSVRNCSGAISFEKSIDSDSLMEAMKTMTEDFNNLIEKVKDYYTTKSDSDYQPLTSSMVEEEGLTDEQAELYNDKAREGVLFGDSILRKLSDELRTIFSGMSAVGITTSSDYTEYGKLTFDADKLKSALEADSQSVMDRFTADKTGALSKLNTLMDKYVKNSISSPGLITAKSGLAESSLSQMTCTMYSEKQSLNNQLKTLQTKLSKQEDRYYSQFTDMEVQLNKIMSQSSYLSQISF